MRISDWSSDVCSSDLYRRLDHVKHGIIAGIVAVVGVGKVGARLRQHLEEQPDAAPAARRLQCPEMAQVAAVHRQDEVEVGEVAGEIGRASCRERACQYV